MPRVIHTSEQKTYEIRAGGRKFELTLSQKGRPNEYEVGEEGSPFPERLVEENIDNGISHKYHLVEVFREDKEELGSITASKESLEKILKIHALDRDIPEQIIENILAAFYGKD